MVLAIDQDSGWTYAGPGYTNTAVLSTTQANDVILLVSVSEGDDAVVTGILDTANLMWTRRAQVPTTGGGVLELWYAIAPSALTSDNIVVSYDTLSNYAQSIVLAFGVSGANTTTPFDPNGSLPDEKESPVARSSISSNPVSTTKAVTMLIALVGAFGGISTITDPTDFTNVEVDTSHEPAGSADYQNVSSPQSGLVVTWTFDVNTRSSIITDAIVDATQPPTSTSAAGTFSGTVKAVELSSVAGAGTESATVSVVRHQAKPVTETESAVATVVSHQSKGGSGTEHGAVAVVSHQLKSGTGVEKASAAVQSHQFEGGSGRFGSAIGMVASQSVTPEGKFQTSVRVRSNEQERSNGTFSSSVKFVVSQVVGAVGKFATAVKGIASGKGVGDGKFAGNGNGAIASGAISGG